MTWNTDISTAPKGRMVTVMRNARTADGVKRVPVQEFQSQRVWLLTKCDKVVDTVFLKGSDKNPGRWAGLATGEQPVAWQEFVVPERPGVSKLHAAADQTIDHLGINDAGAQ